MVPGGGFEPPTRGFSSAALPTELPGRRQACMPAADTACHGRQRYSRQPSPCPREIHGNRRDHRLIQSGQARRAWRVPAARQSSHRRHQRQEWHSAPGTIVQDRYRHSGANRQGVGFSRRHSSAAAGSPQVGQASPLPSLSGLIFVIAAPRSAWRLVHVTRQQAPPACQAPPAPARPARATSLPLPREARSWRQPEPVATPHHGAPTTRRSTIMSAAQTAGPDRPCGRRSSTRPPRVRPIRSGCRGSPASAASSAASNPALAAFEARGHIDCRQAACLAKPQLRRDHRRCLGSRLARGPLPLSRSMAVTARVASIHRTTATGKPHLIRQAALDHRVPVTGKSVRRRGPHILDRQTGIVSPHLTRQPTTIKDAPVASDVCRPFGPGGYQV